MALTPRAHQGRALLLPLVCVWAGACERPEPIDNGDTDAPAPTSVCATGYRADAPTNGAPADEGRDGGGCLNQAFGWSTSGGDFDGDGFADVVVGAPYYTSQFGTKGTGSSGRAVVFKGSEAGLQPTPVWTALSNQGHAELGSSVAGVGDVNADGYDDVLVGAPGCGEGAPDVGGAFLYLGSADGLRTALAWRGVGEADALGFGDQVEPAGDVNGDGYADVLVGTSHYDPDARQYEHSKAYLFLGAASGLSNAPSWTAESDQPHSRFASALSTAGDVNGDGFDDVLVGEPFYDGGAAGLGRVFVFLGSDSGVSDMPDLILEPVPGSQGFGDSVSNAGDVNGDGFDDVVISAWSTASGDLADDGMSLLYLGAADGLSVTPTWQEPLSFDNTVASIELVPGGDLNADGFADVLIGTATTTFEWSGAARAYRGSASGLHAVDTVLLDPVDDFFFSSFYGRSIASPGDVNGDGLDDVVVGAPTYGEPDSAYCDGRVFVYLGPSLAETAPLAP